VTPDLTQDGRYLPEVTISKKDCRARPSTYSPAVFTKDGRRAWPSLPTLPGTDGTIGRQGPGVRTGRLGTLVVDRGSSPIVCSDVLSGGEAVVSILYGGCYLRFTLSSENSAHTCDSPMSPHMPYTSVHALERS